MHCSERLQLEKKYQEANATRVESPQHTLQRMGRFKDVMEEVVLKRQIKSLRGGNASLNIARKMALISQGHAGNRCIFDGAQRSQEMQAVACVRCDE